MRARALTAILLAALFLFTAASPPMLAEKLITLYTHGDRDIPRIAITVDDWNNPELLPAFLDKAAEHGCRLTLYPVGVNLRESDRALWQRALEEGHELGNHSNTHRKMAELSRDSILKQLGNMENNLTTALGYEHPLNTLRYPYGDGRRKGTASAFAAAIRDAGYVHVVLWDVDDGTPKEILRKTKNGSIILLHGNRRSLTTLGKILPELVSRGFEMVTVSELLGLTKTGWAEKEASASQATEPESAPTSAAP